MSNRAELHRRTASPALRVAQHRQLRHDVAEVEIPFADPGVGVAEAEGSVRDNDITGAPVDQHRLERRPLAVVTEVGGGQILPGDVGAIAFLQLHQERQVGVLLDVVDEERCPFARPGIPTG